MFIYVFVFQFYLRVLLQDSKVFQILYDSKPANSRFKTM